MTMRASPKGNVQRVTESALMGRGEKNKFLEDTAEFDKGLGNQNKLFKNIPAKKGKGWSDRQKNASKTKKSHLQKLHGKA